MHILARQYEIQRILGRGRYGTVYLVRDLNETSAEKVFKALKQIPLDDVSEDDQRKDLNEVRILIWVCTQKTTAP